MLRLAQTRQRLCVGVRVAVDVDVSIGGASSEFNFVSCVLLSQNISGKLNQHKQQS